MGLTYSSGGEEGVDYRKVNKVTHKDAYPLPREDDGLDTLAGSRWFSTLDLKSGYWQVEVAPEHRQKTAFLHTEGLYEFNVMPLNCAMHQPLFSI